MREVVSAVKAGTLESDLKVDTDTESQTVGIFKDIQKLLESQKTTLGDVVMMRVYFGVDPAKGEYEGL